MIGFEFETFLLLKARKNLIGSTTPVLEALVNGQKGWHVSPDMRSPIDPETNKPYPDLVPTLMDGKEILPKYSGYGDWEFITQPFMENEDGFKALKSVVSSIIQATNTLESQGIGKDIQLKLLLDKNITWGEHARKNVKENDDIVVFIPKSAQMEIASYKGFSQKSIFASPQMTAGIKLERMPYLFHALGTNNTVSQFLLGRNPVDLPYWNAVFTNALTQANDAVKASFDGFSLKEGTEGYNIYLGAVAFLTHVISLAETATNLTQAKYISPLLSRTNLGHFANFVKPADDFKENILKASKRKSEDKLFPKSPLLLNITISDWLDTVIKGNDPISWGQIRTGTDPHRWDPQKVGPSGKEGLGFVFEFRSLANADYMKWDGVVANGYEVVTGINVSTV